MLSSSNPFLEVSYVLDINHSLAMRLMSGPTCSDNPSIGTGSSPETFYTHRCEHFLHYLKIVHAVNAQSE